MRVEAPQLQRCCFCLPLRRGLIGSGYARLALDILAATYIIVIIEMIYPRYVALNDIVFLLVLAVLPFLDAGFALLLVVAGHLKNAKLLRISFIYCVVWLVLDIAFSAYQIIFQINRISKMSRYYPLAYVITQVVVSLSVKFLALFIQVYIILLIRSEEAKLRNQSLEMEFVNNAAEGQARCVGAGQDRYTEIDNCAPYTVNEHDIAPYTENEHDIAPYTVNQHDIAPYTVNQHDIAPYTVNQNDIAIAPYTVNEHDIEQNTGDENDFQRFRGNENDFLP